LLVQFALESPSHRAFARRAREDPFADRLDLVGTQRPAADRHASPLVRTELPGDLVDEEARGGRARHHALLAREGGGRRTREAIDETVVGAVAHEDQVRLRARGAMAARGGAVLLEDPGLDARKGDRVAPSLLARGLAEEFHSVDVVRAAHARCPHGNHLATLPRAAVRAPLEGDGERGQRRTRIGRLERQLEQIERPVEDLEVRVGAGILHLDGGHAALGARRVRLVETEAQPELAAAVHQPVAVAYLVAVLTGDGPGTAPRGDAGDLDAGETILGCAPTAGQVGNGDVAGGALVRAGRGGCGNRGKQGGEAHAESRRRSAEGASRAHTVPGAVVQHIGQPRFPVNRESSSLWPGLRSSELGGASARAGRASMTFRDRRPGVPSERSARGLPRVRPRS
jgi:hypothetical protein